MGCIDVVIIIFCEIAAVYGDNCKFWWWLLLWWRWQRWQPGETWARRPEAGNTASDCSKPDVEQRRVLSSLCKRSGRSPRAWDRRPRVWSGAPGSNRLLDPIRSPTGLHSHPYEYFPRWSLKNKETTSWLKSPTFFAFHAKDLCHRWKKAWKGA